MLPRSFLPALEFSKSVGSVSSSLPPAAAALTERQGSPFSEFIQMFPAVVGVLVP